MIFCWVEISSNGTQTKTAVLWFNNFFNVGHFLKVFIEFVTTLFLFYVLVLWAMRHVGS